MSRSSASTFRVHARVLTATVLVSLVCLAAGTTRAQSPEPVAAAREHFRRGIELVDEQRYEAALAEFELAYRLRPTFQVLYNIGVVHDALDHTVDAVDTLERYLREGGDRVAAARRAEVQAMIAARSRLIARLVVRVNVEGATIAVDGRDVGRAPLAAPIRLAAGAHTLSVRAPGHESELRTIRLAGDVEETVSIELRPTGLDRARLSVRCAIPDVELRVDDAVVGRTPLDAPLVVAAGRRIVEARRAGYRTWRREIDVVASTETSLDVALLQDPPAPSGELGRVRLVLPAAPYALAIDGAPARPTDGVLRLPRGRHTVSLRARDREPFTSHIDVPGGSLVELRPRLRWTPRALRRADDEASSRRTLGWAASISGAALIVAAVPILIWNETRLNTDEYEALRAMSAMCPGDTSCAGWRVMPQTERQLESYNSTATSVDALRYVGLGAALVGAAALAFGIERVSGAPDRESILERASARAGRVPRLSIGWGGIGLSGGF